MKVVTKQVTPPGPPYSDALTDGPEEVMELPPSYPPGEWLDRADLFRECWSQVTIDGAWAQFGVFKGATAREYLIPALADRHLYLFDSYRGLPEAWEHYHPAGHFATPVPEFDDPRVTNVVGLFADTVPDFDFGGPLGFIDIDCDLYSSTVTVLDACNHVIIPGTILKFDEIFGYEFWREHEYRALQEWLYACNRKIEWFARGGIYWAACRVLR